MNHKTLIMLAVPCLVIGQLGSDAPAQRSYPIAIPAEEDRFSAAVFRAGLKERGLASLLELHLSDFPPSNESEKQLMLRDLKLAEFADQSRTMADRLASAAQANRILESVIEQGRQDPRRMEWRITLTQSLLYDEAQPLLTNILYRIAGDQDYDRLRSLMTRAIGHLRKLQRELGIELARVESLDVQAFDQLEASGYIEKIDRLGPYGEYLLLWSLLYESLTRQDDDFIRVEQLHEIVDRLKVSVALLNTPHRVSHVQIPALLLAGMTHRLLNDHVTARIHLDRALSEFDRLTDGEDIRQTDWAITLTWLERIRNEASAGHFEKAFEWLSKFRERITQQRNDDFNERIMAALLERSLIRQQADVALSLDQPLVAKEYLARAWRPLSALTKLLPKRRDEIYTVLADSFPLDVDPLTLDPIEQCALLAGLLYRADQHPEQAETALEQGLQIGHDFLAGPHGQDETLQPEIIYNLGVIHFKRQQQDQAARHFLQIAQEHPTFFKAKQAASLAVQLAWEGYSRADTSHEVSATSLYRTALETLLNQYADSKAGRYWRFYYAQLLDEQRGYLLAAAQYALVHEAHDLHLESLFFRTRCLALKIKELNSDTPSEQTETDRLASAFFDSTRTFTAKATRAKNPAADTPRLQVLSTLLARSTLLKAEVEITSGLHRPQRGLETLLNFEQVFPNQPRLAARVWRARLIAYQQLGQLYEATQAIPIYLAAAPKDAGMTLQALYQSLAEEIQRRRSQGDADSAKQQAAMALVLAEQIHHWSLTADPAMVPLSSAALRVQLASAHLQAEKYQRALELFEPLVHEIVDFSVVGDRTILHGFAESLYQRGRFRDALIWFNRLATGLPATDPIRFQTLLRDLQCRSALGARPEDVIKVIDQQEHLYPKLGGVATASALKRLRRDQRRKLDDLDG